MKRFFLLAFIFSACNSTTSERFLIQDGIYTITNIRSGLLLTMDRHSIRSGSKTVQWYNEFTDTTTHDGHQEWVIKQTQDRWYTIQNKKSGLYMSLMNNANQPTPIIQRHLELDKIQAEYQMWGFFQIAEGVVAIRNKKTNMPMTVNSHNLKPDDVVQWTDEFNVYRDGHQEWQLAAISSDTLSK